MENKPTKPKRGVKLRKCCNTKHASSEACPLFLRNRPKQNRKVWAK